MTVAAIIEQDGRFLLVEEETEQGLRFNQPAGHLDPGESLITAVSRETLEETAYDFTPQAVIGIYHHTVEGSGITYIRFAFCGALGAHQSGRPLDTGIVRTVWLTPAEIRACAARHRTPLVMRCIDDYLSGSRFPLSVLRGRPGGLR